MSSNPILATNQTVDRCLLCDESIVEKEKKAIQEKGFKTAHKTALLRSALDKRVCIEQPYKAFREAQLRMPNAFTGTLYAHKSCAVSFRNRLENKQKQSDKLRELDVASNIESSASPGEGSEPSATNVKKSKIQREKRIKRTCLICNIITPNDHLLGKEGGLYRCSELRSAGKISQALADKLNDESDEYHCAAKRIDLLLGASGYDIFAVDLFYHHLCYVCFTRSSKKSDFANEDEVQERKATEYFDEFVRRKVVQDEQAFLMPELLNDYDEICMEFNVTDKRIQSVKYLKKHLEEVFAEEICFSKLAERKWVIHSSAVDPLTYIGATLKGCGL